MSDEQALELSGKCVEVAVWAIIGADEPPPDLSEYSLSDLIEANEIVAEMNPVKQPDGSTVLHTTLDNRLLAALYVMHHCEPNDTRPIAELPGMELFLKRSGREDGCDDS